MQYLMKSGTLWIPGGGTLCTLQKILFQTEKRVFRNDGTAALRVYMEKSGEAPEKQGDVRFHTYLMEDPQGKRIATAKPAYSPGEDPDIAGWPVCRMPRADRAQLKLRDKSYLLIMLNSQNYVLKDEKDNTVLQVLHRGMIGGWTIEGELAEPPEVLCGLFAFCRYLEQENEMMIV